MLGNSPLITTQPPITFTIMPWGLLRSQIIIIHIYTKYLYRYNASKKMVRINTPR